MKRKLLNVFFLALIMQIFSNFSIATNYIVSGSFYMDGLYIESGTYNGQPNISTSDPLLLSLADNGGSTKTFSVQDGSPVINSGLTGADIPIKDQRGYYRNGISNIGAYEYNGLPCLPTSSIITQTACSSYTINDSIYTQTGLYTQHLINAEGCDSTITINLTINPLPMADAGVDQTVCKGDTAILIATGGGTYNWSNGPTTATIKVVPTITTTYKLTTTVNGCTATDDVVVTVPTLPTAGFTYSNACVGSAKCFINTTLAGSYPITGNNWTFGDGGTSNQVSPCHTYHGSGNRKVTLDLVDNFGCKSSVSHTITVYTTPLADFNYDTVCLNTTTHFTNQTAAGSGGTFGTMTYSWAFGDGGTSTLTTPSHNYGTSGTFTVTLTATDTSNCSGNASHDIIVRALPIANAGVDKTICQGDTAHLTGFGGGTYTWSTGEYSQIINVSPTVTTTYYLIVNNGSCSATNNVVVTVMSLPFVNAGVNETICNGSCAILTASGGGSYQWITNETSPIISVCPSTTTKYYVTGTNGNGCSAMDSVIVTVLPSPIANAGADKTICQDSSLILTATGGSTYIWRNGQVSSSIMVSPTITTTYNVTVSSNGCTASDQMVVYVNPKPDLVITPANQTICAYDYVTITGNITGGGGTWVWSNSATSNTVIDNPASTTTYCATVTKNGCSSSACAVVNVTPLPVAELGPDYTICKGDSVILKANGGGVYSWSTGQTISSIMVSPTITTTYNVTVTSNGCIATDDVVLTVNQLPILNAGSDRTICNGSCAILITTGAISYVWNNGCNMAAISACPTTTTKYYVTGTNGNGCSAKDSVTVTVNALPIANAGVNQTICQGETVHMTGFGGGSYTWSTGEYSQIIYVSPTVTTTYNLTVTLNECTATDNVIVTVNPLPSVTVGPDQTICNGSCTILTASSGSSYQWITNETSPIISVCPTTTTKYYVTGTNANGCSAMDSVIVTVLPSPIANAGADKTICQGSSVILTATATGGLTYTWSNGLYTQCINVSPTVTTTYNLTVTSNGCTASDQMVVYVNPKPDLVITPANQTICAGYNATITGNITGGGGTWVWSNSATSNTVIDNPASTTTYCVTVTKNGCSSSACAVVNVTPKDLNNSLVAYYPFNGNAKDMSGNNNDATVFGASLTTDRFGNQNSAYSFNGTDNYMKILQSPSLMSLTNATFSYWVKYTLADGKVASVISNGPDGNSYNEDGFFTWALNKSIMHNLGRQGNFQSASIGYNATKTTNYQNFVHVVVVIDGDSIKTYRNGVLQQKTPRNGKSISRPHLDWFIGQSGANTYYLNGVMDDIRIYNRAITECEISDLYNENRCEVTISNSHGITPCSGMPTLLTGGGCKVYSWSTGETTPDISVTPTVPTTYSVTGTNGGCTAIASLEIIPAIVDINSGLALHIPFENNVTDASINNNSVSLYGGATLTSDRFGNTNSAMSFDGTTGYVKIAQSPSLNNLQNATISYWVKYNTPASKVGVTISNGPDGAAEEGFYNYATSNKLMYYLGKSKDPNNVFATISYDATQPLASQQFNFVTIVIDENSISTYLNGKLQETNPRNGMPISRPGQDWYIGQSGAKTQFLNGAMDDIRIYNRALNPCEISTLYNTNNCGVPLNAMTKTVCKGYPATITIGGNVDATYKWSTGSTGTIQTVSPTVSTKYYITVTQPSGCKSIDSYWVYVVNCSEDASNSGELGMMNDELKGKLSLNIYPNPVMEELNIVNATNSQIRIFDMLGNEINYIEKATEHVKINMSRLSAGLYFVKIISDDGIITKRIVVYK